MYERSACFNTQEIREVVQQLVEDADRQFSPRPAEVRATILLRSPASRAASVDGGQVSMRASEIMVEARVFLQDCAVSADVVARELEQVLAENTHQGRV